jgi:agmatine deiminase
MSDANLPEIGDLRMPAEWEPQEAVWLSWPANPVLWPGCRDRVEKAWATFAEAISRFAKLHLNCEAKLQPRIGELLAEANVNFDQVKFFDHPCNDVWCRDHGPIFVKNARRDNLAIIDFKYNSWGGKYPPWDLDNAIPARVAEALKLTRYEFAMVAEGGALETNGKGALLTTESVLLNKNRNPDLTRSQIEVTLQRTLGVRQIVWLPDGLAGDDTDGHIDTLSRFCDAETIVTCVDHDVNSANHAPLSVNREILKNLRFSNGQRANIIDLPLPDPIRPAGWRTEILPGTYANFLIVNDAVLLPVYRQPQKDREAIKIIASAFPRHQVVTIDSRDILLEGGALHCLSQQQPSID